MTYEFKGTLYRTESDMLLAIASAFLSQNGKHTEEQQRDTLNEFTDEEHATECIFGLGLNKPTLEEHGQTWLEARSLDLSDISAAFYDLRARF